MALSSRLPIFTAVLAAALFVAALLHSRDKLPAALVNSWKFRKPQPTFHEIAFKYGTDKVTAHSYHNMYHKYLPAFRNQPLKMLEIGLGCDMGYGPGASYYTWLEYFPYVDLYYIEFDAACATKWAANTTGATIFAGDQADIAFLDHFLAESGGDFDVIIDDGGHTMNQQITSLEHLFKAVVPGGVYFCEDLQTSYEDRFGGGKAAQEPGKMSTIAFIQELLDDLNTGRGASGPARKHPVSEEMVSVDCMQEICAFWKKDYGM